MSRTALSLIRQSTIAAVLAAASALAVPTSRPAERPVRETVTVLTQQGVAALEADDKQASLDSYLDAYQLLRTDRQIGQGDPLRVTAAHGLAVAYYRAGRVDKAGELFKAGDLLDKVLATPATAPRPLVVNRVVLDLKQKFNVMRAVKTARDYLAAHSDAVDEELLNLLGTAMDLAADDRYAATPLYAETVKFYDQQVAKLEATRPGQRRWGIEWVSEEEFNTRTRSRQKFVDTYRRKADKLADARRELKDAESDVSQEQAKRRMGRANNLSGAQDRKARAQTAVDSADRAAAEARQQIPHFPWVQDFQPVLPNGPTEVVAIAVVKPPVVDPKLLKPPSHVPVPEKKPDEPVANHNPPPVVAPVNPPKPADDPKPAEPPKPARVTRYAAAFPIAPDKLLTAAAAVERADRITLEDSQGNSFTATVVRADEKSGLALLKVEGQRFAFLNLASGYAGGSDIKCTSFPKVSIFSPIAEQITGKSGLLKQGDSGPWYVTLAANPRLPGAPLVTSNNELVGVEMAQRDSAPGQIPAIRVEAVREFLGADAPNVVCSNPDPNFVMMLTAVVGK